MDKGNQICYLILKQLKTGIVSMILINLNYLQDCVMGALAMKTVVLVTHQVEFLSTVDKILVSTVYLLCT
jgi:hypothetical protein